AAWRPPRGSGPSLTFIGASAALAGEDQEVLIRCGLPLVGTSGDRLNPHSLCTGGSVGICASSVPDSAGKSPSLLLDPVRPRPLHAEWRARSVLRQRRKGDDDALPAEHGDHADHDPEQPSNREVPFYGGRRAIRVQVQAALEGPPRPNVPALFLAEGLL